MQMSLICDTKKQKMQSTWNESYSEKLNSSNIQIHIDGGDSNRCEFATFNQKKINWSVSYNFIGQFRLMNSEVKIESNKLELYTNCME